MKKKAAATLLACLLAAGLAGCSADAGQQQGQTDHSAESTADASGTEKSVEEVLRFTDRDKDPSYDEASATKIELSGSSATVAGAGASVEGSTVTISADGTYIVSGALEDGQLLVDLPGEEDKAQVVLAGASIANADGPALYVRQADKVFVTLAEGTENALADGADYAATNDGNEPKAALYSKDDLTINGAGSLTVTGSYYHGIASTDDLVVTGGAISVTSKEDAFHGKDAVKIGGGAITVSAGDDAFHSEYFFYIADGTVDVQKCTEGYEAEQVYIHGGDSTIVASDDGVNAAEAEEEDTSATTAASLEGAQRAQDGGGARAERSVSAGDSSVPADGGVLVAFGDDAPADGGRGGKGGSRMPQNGETLEGMPERGAMPDGEMPDMPEGGFDGGKGGGPRGELPEGEMPEGGFGGKGGMQGGPGGAMAGASADCLIQINGGTLRVDAGGDGLDSNGAIEINGGTVLVSGSTNSGDSGLDSEFGATVNGGDVIIAGMAGMAEGFSGGDQESLSERASGQAGSTVEVLDDAGAVLVSWTVPKAFQSVVASAPGCASIAVR